MRAYVAAGAAWGQRRSNEDKRRAVEIALREFGHLSSRAIAALCGVGHQLVLAVRPERQVDDSSTSPVTGRDGKQYPARRPRVDSTKPAGDRAQSQPVVTRKRRGG